MLSRQSGGHVDKIAFSMSRIVMDFKTHRVLQELYDNKDMEERYIDDENQQEQKKSSLEVDMDEIQIDI